MKVTGRTINARVKGLTSCRNRNFCILDNGRTIKFREKGFSSAKEEISTMKGFTAKARSQAKDCWNKSTVHSISAKSSKI